MNESTPPNSNARGNLANDLNVGSIFAQRFELLEIIGNGSSGSAYKARDVLLERTVLLKILHTHLLISPAAVERFRREAITTIKLTHPGIVQVFVHGVADDGRSFLVMDYLQGASLAQILASERQLALDRALILFAQLVEALQFAHEHNVIHRDIKPGNIIIVPDGEAARAVLVDFGIAKVLDEANEQSSTKTGEMLGSTSYMSPEQCVGASADGRSDIYSLACVIYECLFGEPLFAGTSSFDVMYKHLNQSVNELVRLNELPDSLAKLLRKCLAKEANERFSSMAELRSALACCSNLRDTVKRNWQPKRTGRAGAQKTGRTVTIALVSIAIVLFCSSISLYKNSRRNMEPGLVRTSKKLGRQKPVFDSQHLRMEESWLRDALDDYAANPAMSKALLLSWCERFMKSTAPEALDGKILALRHLTKLASSDSNYDEELSYLRQLATLRLEKQSDQLFVSLHTGEVLEKKLMYGEAIAAFDAGLAKIDRRNGSIQADIVNTLAAEADAYAALRNYKKAISLYRDATALALKNDPQDEHIKSLRGKMIILLELNGNEKEADELLKTTLNDVPLYLQRKRRPDNSFLSPSRLLKAESIPSSSSQTPAQLQQDTKKNIAEFYVFLQIWSRDLHAYSTYIKFGQLAATANLQLGNVDKAAKILSSTSEEAANCADNISAVKFAKECLPLLDKSKNDMAKLKLLTSLSYIYHFDLSMPDEERVYFPQALALFEKQLQRNPDLLWQESDPVYVRLVAFMRCGVLTRASFGKLIDFYIDKCEGHRCANLDGFLKEKATYLMAQSKFADAEQLANKCIAEANGRKDQDWLFFWLDLKAKALACEGKFVQELAVLDQTAKIQKGTSSKDWQGELQVRYAICYTEIGQKEKADQSCKALLTALGPDTPENNAKLAPAAVEQLRWCANYMATRGNESQAILQLNRIIKEETLLKGLDSPSLVLPSFDLALLLLRQNDCEEACKIFRKIVEICDKYGVNSGIHMKSLEYLKNCKH